MSKIEKTTERITQTKDLTFAQKEQHIGPVPDPETLLRYENIQNGFAERLMKMAEKEQNSRIVHNERLIDLEFNESNTRRWGIFAGLLAVFLVISLSFYAFWLGYATQGAAIIVGGVITNVAAVFVTRRWFNKDPTEKPS